MDRWTDGEIFNVDILDLLKDLVILIFKCIIFVAVLYVGYKLGFRKTDHNK